MSNRLHLLVLGLLGGLTGGQFCFASSDLADLAPPKQREVTVAAATKLLAARTAPVSLPEQVPNPFVSQAAVEDTTLGAIETTSAPPVNGGDLLARLATLVPASGTVSLGGKPILLLGQKRLKVGDVYTISFEGQAHDLSIVAITPTSFTVSAGGFTHTRPIRLPSLATQVTPSTRP